MVVSTSCMICVCAPLLPPPHDCLLVTLFHWNTVAREFSKRGPRSFVDRKTTNTYGGVLAAAHFRTTSWHACELAHKRCQDHPLDLGHVSACEYPTMTWPRDALSPHMQGRSGLPSGLNPGGQPIEASGSVADAMGAATGVGSLAPVGA